MGKIKKHSKSREEREEGRAKKKDKNCKMEEMRQTKGCDNQGLLYKKHCT